MLSYYALNGRPRPTELVERKMAWTSPHALEVLFSPEHGLFAWTPLAVLAIAGLVILALGRVRTAAPDARWIGIVALVMTAAQVYVTGAVESWTLAGSFGQRRFIALTPLLTLGMAVLFKTSGVVFSKRSSENDTRRLSSRRPSLPRSCCVSGGTPGSSSSSVCTGWIASV